MDSCEGSDDYITQSKIVPAKSAALVCRFEGPSLSPFLFLFLLCGRSI
jgi:hypothetical protein